MERYEVEYLEHLQNSGGDSSSESYFGKKIGMFGGSDLFGSTYEVQELVDMAKGEKGSIAKRMLARNGLNNSGIFIDEEYSQYNEYFSWCSQSEQWRLNVNMQYFIDKFRDEDEDYY